MKFFYIFQILVVALVLLWLSGLLFFNISNSLPKKEPGNADSIVVFTGGPARIEKGLAFFAAGKSQYLFISGTHPDVVPKEIISKWNGKKPLPKCCMVLGQKATTTEENAQETKEWAQKNNVKTIILITSDYHMARAKLETSHVLPDVTILPFSVHSYLPHQSRAKLFLSEYNKTLYRWIQIQMSNLAKLY